VLFDGTYSEYEKHNGKINPDKKHKKLMAS
jgi:hypothetical protein